jgi:hypothetical protein
MARGGVFVDAIGMTRLKRFIRPGFVISAVGHGSVLILWLLFVIGANSSQQTPPSPPAIPPDAMVVDIVPPKETPRLEGTPSDAAVSGSQVPLKSNSANIAAQKEPRKPAAPSPPQPSSPQQKTDPKTAEPQPAQPATVKAAMELPVAAQPETAHPQTAQPDTAPPELAKAQTSEPQPSPPQPDPAETPDQPDAEETVARLALLGGALGGGFEAPPIDAPTAAHDFTLAFRERVSTCSVLPGELGFGDKTSISLRVSFNIDGTLASTPKLNGTIASHKERALMESSIRALEKCQPYTMLPPEKYKIWKTLDLVFAPMNFPDR